MDGQTWIDRTLLPSLEHLPDATDDPVPPTELQALVLLRAWGAVDALAETGVLDPDQERRAREALAAKGVTGGDTVVHHVASSFVTGVATRVTAPVPPEPEAPDVLRRVLGVGRAMGMVDDEPLTMLAVEVWNRSVRVGFLLPLGDRARARQEEFHRELRAWGDRQRAGEPGDPPPRGVLPWHPTGSLDWRLDLDGEATEGRLVSGSGADREWRQEVTWDVAVPDSATSFTVEVLDGDTVVGRQVVSLA